MKSVINIILKLSRVDRRWIFLIIGLSVLLPLFFPLGLPIRATDTTQIVYNAFDSLDPNSKVLYLVNMAPAQNLKYTLWSLQYCINFLETIIKFM